MTDAMPVNLGAGTNEDRIVETRMDDHLWFEGDLRARAMTEVLSGTLQVRLQVYSYVAAHVRALPRRHERHRRHRPHHADVLRSRSPAPAVRAQASPRHSTTEKESIDMSNPEKPAEFSTGEQRKNHIAGLVREQKGYEAKAAGAEKSGDETNAELYKGRASQVGNELKRLGDRARPGAGQAQR